MNDLELAKIARLVFFVRGEKVMLDADLARLYGVTTGNLNKAVKRNQRRFPGDFIFQLTEKETENLIFQSGRSKGRGGRRHRPVKPEPSPSRMERAGMSDMAGKAAR